MEQVCYRPLKPEDAPALYALWSDWEVIRYTNVEKSCTLEEVQGRLAALRDHETFAVERQGELIGILGCPAVDRTQGTYGLFYQFRRDCWGRGYATAGVAWLLEYMHSRYGAITLYADVVEENTASVRILQRFGFQLQSRAICQHRGKRTTICNYRLELQ